MRRISVAAVVAATCLLPAQAAAAAEVPVGDLAAVDGLTSAQLEAIESFADSEVVEAGGLVDIPIDRPSAGIVVAANVFDGRASYYRGTRLMWTRDSVADLSIPAHPEGLACWF